MPLITTLVLVLALVLAACGDDAGVLIDEPTTAGDGDDLAAGGAQLALPDRPADIQGVITEVEGDRVLVETPDGTAAGWASLGTQTAIHLGDGSMGGVDDLAPGTPVDLWWDGEVMESFPLQGGAQALWVHDETDRDATEGTVGQDAEGIERIPFEDQLIVAWHTDDQISPETTSFTALVGGPVCATGDGEATRDTTTHVAAMPDIVVVTVTVELGGAARTCTDDGSLTEVTVDLGEPLGDRELRDGGQLVDDERDPSEPVTDGGDPNPES